MREPADRGGRPPRRRWVLVPVLLVGLAVAEVAAFVAAVRVLGVGWTVLLLMATSVPGVLLLRREGVRAWRRFRAAGGGPVGASVTDGLVGLGGALLLAGPGFVTDVLGGLSLLPPVRRLVSVGVRGYAERRMSAAAAGGLFGPRRVRVRPPQRASPAAPDDGPGPPIEGEIVER